MIIGIVSLARAGKDTVADYLVSNHSFTKVNTSDILVSSLLKMGKEPTKANQSWLGDVWRKDSGRMDIVTLRSLENLPSGNIVVTGLRSQEEIDLLREKFPGAIILAIMADKHIRYSRRKPNDAQDMQGFFARDKRDIENKGLAKALADADHFICNNSSLESLHLNIDKLLDMLWQNTG
jgi:dephospho-CoA kinase